jgi:hypothetical protein
MKKKAADNLNKFISFSEKWTEKAKLKPEALQKN